MPEMDRGEQWESAHVFFDGALYDQEADRLLLETVAPSIDSCTARGWTDRHFVVRFGVGGSHLRVRMRRTGSIDRLAIRRCLADRLVQSYPTADIALDDAPFSSGALPPSFNGTVLRWVSYEPEMIRYGGAHALGLAEVLFTSSTDTAIALLSEFDPRRRDIRMGRALAATLVLLHAFVPSTAQLVSLAKRYATSLPRPRPDTHSVNVAWRSRAEASFDEQAGRLTSAVGTLLHLLKRRLSVSTSLDRYYGAMRASHRDLRSAWRDGAVLFANARRPRWRDCVAQLVPSYAHMMNNRLGVSQREELCLAYLIARCVSEQAKP